MHEEMCDGEGWCYPRSALEPLLDAVRREWSLFDRALALNPPPGWLGLTRCKRCGHVGDARFREPPLTARILEFFGGRLQWSRAVCARCGSETLTNLRDPEARAAYLDSLQARGDE
jgi:hypothetical protein